MTGQTHYSRRQFLSYGTAIGVSAALAGCSSQSGEVGIYRGQTVTYDEVNEESLDETFDSIQQALDEAAPGDTVIVPPGRYRERVTTTRSGTADDPITITGPESATLCGAPNKYSIMRIYHSHIHLTGLTVDGLQTPDKPDQLSSYVEGQLIQTRPSPSSDEYLQDIAFRSLQIGHSRESLIGLERTVGAEIGPCTITGHAGADYLLGDAESRNGELFYVGTSHSNLGTSWHPWTALDETRDVRIHHIDNSAGHAHAMAVDMKEGTRNITAEYITDRNAGHVGIDATPGSVSFKSHNSTVRWCDFAEMPVAAEFAPALSDQEVYGNDLYGCRIHDVDEEPIAVTSDQTSLDEQGTLCGNRIEGADGYQPTVCPAEIPTSETVGHTENSRWLP